MGDWASEELFRDVWHCRIPGRTFEDKVRALLNFYEISDTIASKRLEETPRFITDDCGRMLALENLPPDTITIRAEADCRWCGLEGYKEIYVDELGWHLKSDLENDLGCPECGWKMIKLNAKLGKDAGL